MIKWIAKVGTRAPAETFKGKAKLIERALGIWKQNHPSGNKIKI